MPLRKIKKKSSTEYLGFYCVWHRQSSGEWTSIIGTISRNGSGWYSKPKRGRYQLGPFKTLKLAINELDYDVCCPVACGQCCLDYWRSVFPNSHADNYPYLGERGCKLGRLKRPEACREHLCGVGLAVLLGEVSMKTARRIVVDCLQDNPDKWEKYDYRKH